MSVNDGQDADETVFNAAFASKTNDNSFTGIQTLARALSGATVTDLQSAINALIAAFSTSTGHDHDGVDSKLVSANNLANKDTNMVQSIHAGSGTVQGAVIVEDGTNIEVARSGQTLTVNYLGPDKRGEIFESPLDDNTSSPTDVPSAVVPIADYMGMKIEFWATRGAGNYRYGILTIIAEVDAGISGDCYITEGNGMQIGLEDLGLTFTAVMENSVGTDSIVLKFVTTNTGTDVEIIYNIWKMPIPNP